MIEVAARRNVSPVREEIAVEADVVKAPEEISSRPVIPRPPVAARPTATSPTEISSQPEATLPEPYQSNFASSTDEPEIVEIAVVPAQEPPSQPLPEQLPEQRLEQSSSEALIPAGAPGSARQALQSSVALGPRAVTEDNPEESGSLIRNRRRRREEAEPEPAARPAPPVNNNRLAVPNTAIPIGSGSSTVFSPPSGGAGAPPAPPSRAQSLGLYYRVFVEANDPFVQDEVREVIPDAFRIRFEGRTVMQVGAFPTEEEAEERQDILEDNDFNARIEYIR